MGVEQHAMLINNSNELQSAEDTPKMFILNQEISSENCLLKYKAPNNISSFFQKIRDFKNDIDIQEILDWYSKLDGPSKNKICSYKSQELIHLVSNLYINKKKEFQKKNKVSGKSFCDQEKDIYGKELTKEDLDRYNGMYSYEEEKKSYESDVPTTKETENIDELNINRNQANEEDFLKYLKICSLKDDADTLIFSIGSNELKKYLNYFCKDDSKIKPINPELINNEWYITLPNWEDLQSFFQIIACTFILLHYEYFLITGKINKMPFFNELNHFFQENDFKINELLKNKVDAIADILSMHNLIYLAEKCSSNYIEHYSDKEFKPDKNKFYLKNIEFLEDLKNNFSESEKNEEKLKKLIEKVSFYNLEDLRLVKHFIYFELRNFLLKYKEINQSIDVIYRNILYNTEKLKPIKDQYLESTKEALKEKLDNIKFVQFGSYFTGLCTEFSDIDILIVYHDDRTEIEYGNYLKKVLEDIKKEKNFKNLVIESHLDNINAPPLITITYDISKEITGINFSLKYLDAKKDDLNKLKIDITFTNNTDKKKRVKKTEETVRIIKESLKKYKQLKPVVLYLKIYFKMQGEYSTYKGGINSLIIFCLARNIFVMCELSHIDVNTLPNGLILFFLSEKFGHYNYLWGIDKDGKDYFLNVQEIIKHRFVINSPTDNKYNIAYGCYRPDDIITKFYLLSDHMKKRKDIFLPLQELLKFN